MKEGIVNKSGVWRRKTLTMNVINYLKENIITYAKIENSKNNLTR